MIPLTLNTLLTDMYYEKFGVEEEDHLKNMASPGIKYNLIKYIDLI